MPRRAGGRAGRTRIVFVIPIVRHVVGADTLRIRKCLEVVVAAEMPAVVHPLVATRFNILFQFLVEALVLCMVGGIMGILFGSLGAVALSSLAHWNTSINFFAILVAFLFSAVVGLFFGIWPARRA